MIIKQIAGLPMGDPLSPPLAIIYLSFDEHAYKLPSNISCMPVLIIRYVDDIICLIAYDINNISIIPLVNNYITNNIYEHDVTDKCILIVPNASDDSKFLDNDVIVYDNNTKVKSLYHNKNSDILFTLHQDVGRFYELDDYMDFRVKLSAFVNILVRAYDACTYSVDVLSTVVELMCEMRSLGYSESHMFSALVKANRTRKDQVWTTLYDFAKAVSPSFMSRVRKKWHHA